MPDPWYTWFWLAVGWGAFLAREAYLRGLRRGRALGRRRGDVLRVAPPDGPRPAPPPPPAPPRLRDGMTVDEAARAMGVTVDDFQRMIRR